MSTPHISAEKGDFAKTVLMPGDPLRAKFIADTFLKDVRQVTGVRGMLGFTGTYEGRPISVMGSGMGMPSIGIYSYELFKFYDVENIIRIGSAGSYTDKAKLFDVVLAAGAVSESNYARVQSGFEGDITLPTTTELRTIGLADISGRFSGKTTGRQWKYLGQRKNAFFRLDPCSFQRKRIESRTDLLLESKELG